MDLTAEEGARFNRIVRHGRPLRRGDHIFRAGESFSAIFFIKSGWVKNYVTNDEGSEQVLGFHIAGEFLGLEALEQKAHRFSAQTLEIAVVCEVPFKPLEDLAADIPALQHQIYLLMSREIRHEFEMLALFGKRSAEEKLAAFLLDLSQRLRVRGLASQNFHLSMSRHDIASYLGLAVETVSRLFSRFQEESLLAVDRRHIQWLDVQRLENMLADTAPDTAPEAARRQGP